VNAKLLIVAALEREVAPLVRGVQRHVVRSLDREIQLFDLPAALVAVGGIGTVSARVATELAYRHLERRASLIISAGLAGAVAPDLKVAAIFRPETIVDEADRQTIHLPDGDGVLVTVSSIASDSKRDLAARFSAQAVDMEAYAVGDVARIHKVPFMAVKAISDELDFNMPPLGRFISDKGRFQIGSFAFHAALRPWTWRSVIELGRNSARAAQALCAELERIIQEFSRTDRYNRVDL
jgi:adenosylhomocysteine nucleosidase